MKLRVFGHNSDKSELWIRTSLAYQVAKYIQGAKYYHAEPCDVVTMPWTLDNTLKAALVGCPVASPMVRDYTYTGRFKPFMHQQRICSFLTTNQRAFCLADMGTGKTASSVWSVDYLIKIGEVKKVLVACDMNNMRGAWQNEFFHINPQLRTTVIHDNSRAEKDLLAYASTPVHIINHDGVKSMYKQLLRNNYDLIIFDELTRFKNPRTGRFKCAEELAKKAKWVWGLTGTPTPNAPDEAYGQIKLVNPTKVAKYNYYTWREKVMRKVTQFKWVPRDTANETVREHMQPAIYIKKEDCIDLPPLTNIYQEVQLSADQLKWYQDLSRHKYASGGEFGTITAVNGGALMNKLIQIATGAIYNDEGVAFAIDIKDRLETCRDIIRRSREESTDPKKGKTLLFVPFKHTAEIVRQYLVDYFKIALITGDTPVKERDTIIYNFQNEMEPDVIIAVPGTMSHGVTATSASTIIWFAPVASNEVYSQACARINRPGQTQHMQIVHLYGSRVEHKLYQLLINRQVSQSALLGLYDEFFETL